MGYLELVPDTKLYKAGLCYLLLMIGYIYIYIYFVKIMITLKSQDFEFKRLLVLQGIS